MHEIKFPKHTQACMDAAKEAKAAKIASLTTMAALPPVTDASVASKENKETGLPGRVAGLDSDGRRAILGSRSLVTIAYGTLEKPIILMDKVNMAMLQHYIPKIVDAYHVTSTESEDIILLPNSMNLVTERGIKHVVQCMRQEMQRGSYSGKSFTKDAKHTGRYMIRPHSNAVDNIHALNTLRAFGLKRDAEFLARKDGPVAAGLKRRAQQWTGGLGGLQKFIDTMGRELLDGQDMELLSEARAVYEELRRSAQASAGTRKA